MRPLTTRKLIDNPRNSAQKKFNAFFAERNKKIERIISLCKKAKLRAETDKGFDCYGNHDYIVLTQCSNNHILKAIEITDGNYDKVISYLEKTFPNL